jgi:hypothetical protein
MSGQERVDEYAGDVKRRLRAQRAASGERDAHGNR